MKINYLNNRDLLEEIHLSKNTYCSFTKPEYHRYDIILPSLDKINIRTIAEAKRNKAKKLSQQIYEEKKLAGEKVKQADCEIDYKKIQKTDLVFRIMTYDHIPLNNTRKRNPKSTADHRDKVNFPPFQHWKFDENDTLVCVGKSHWKGCIENGKFSKDHGQITNKLAKMYMKLCERYATRGNVRGYCVDTSTEALTQRGWLDIDSINETDTILSYNEKKFAWSKIKSIYRGEYDGLMHYITSQGADFLITPEHKIVTTSGLITAEMLKQNDKVVIIGEAEPGVEVEIYNNDFVELAALLVTNSQYKTTSNTTTISIYEDEHASLDYIRQCLSRSEVSFSEIASQNGNYFLLSKAASDKFLNLIPDNQLSVQFFAELTKYQRKLLISVLLSYFTGAQQSKYFKLNPYHVGIFQALLTLAGIKSNYNSTTGLVDVYTRGHNKIFAKYLNFNGGLDNGMRAKKFLGKKEFPNKPTVPYKGRVWCPETEYGCFVARRNGKVYLTGNTYNDEMKSQAILQLTQIGLQFNESKSDNPFAYFTTAVINSFVKIINMEKRNQTIRDDLLEINGMNPSYTRSSESDHSYAIKRFENDE